MVLDVNPEAKKISLSIKALGSEGQPEQEDEAFVQAEESAGFVQEAQEEDNAPSAETEETDAQ